ncbi:LamG-like jellyroll fold domain-containing protein [Actinoplanes sp. NPDC051494]|uniref:LamG-like jellyroll fold domain-containing protein n=1 Tax=Actinoplanes sp. NPDC051494 TaxID=3363907 RepID=UPI00379BDF0A
MKRRRLLVLVLIAGALSIGGGVAWAYWTAPSTPGSSGAGRAATVNAAITPTTSKYAAQAVAVSWPAVTLSNGVAVDGYVIKRYDTATQTAQTVLSGCTGTLTTLTCTESNVPTGSWRYSVRPVLGANWVGPESGLSTSISTAPAVLTLAQTTFKGPFPATTTGTVTGFGVNEAYTYKLDGSTTLTGFPTVVDVTGSAPISSLSIPSASEGTHTVSVVGANGSTASVTITIDTVGPIVSSMQSPLANGAGWNNSTPVQVTLSAIDATSSVASIKYTTDGSDPSVSGTALIYSTPFAVASTTTVRYYATDTVGNASAIGSRPIKIDTVAPVNALTLSSATGALLTGTTIYYRGIATGTFTVTNALTDAASGPASSSTAALGGTSTGFTHTASTVSTPGGGPYVSNAFGWTAGTTSTPTVTVTGADVAGNTTGTTLSLVNDSTPPTGGTVDATGLTGTGTRYSTSTSISVAFTKGSDAGVGLATTGFLLQRASATLSAGTCGTYGSATTVATDPTSPYADPVTDQACYRYQYVAADRVGNTTTYLGGDVKVDTTAPSAPSLAGSAQSNTYLTGTTLYYRSNAASGSVTLTANATDAASGILSYAFPAYPAGWSSTPGATGVNTYAWSSAPAAPGARTVTATNNAFLATGTSLTATDDTIAPTGAAPTYTGSYLSSASVSITIPAGADTLSGVSATLGQLQRRSATMTAGICAAYPPTFTTIATGVTSPYADTTVANGNCYQYQYVYSDNVGNTQAYASSTTVKAPKYYTCAAAVAADTPEEYYRLAETTGTVAADSSGKNRPGTYTGTVALGTLGACGTGITLTNAAGYVATPQTFANPSTLSEEVWFKANVAGTTGRLVGFGQASTGGSPNYDRHVWMSTDGKINFGVYGVLVVLPVYNILTSPSSYNDGQWHHVVATMSSTGMQLYVDGTSVGSNTVNNGQNYTGYFRVGWDYNSGWNSQTNTDYFRGSLSNAAFYTTALTATQVTDHFIAGIASSGGLITAPAAIASVQSTPQSGRRATPAPSASPSASASASPSFSPSPSFAPSSSFAPSPSDGPSPSAAPSGTAPTQPSATPAPSSMDAPSATPSPSDSSPPPTTPPPSPTPSVGWSGKGISYAVPTPAPGPSPPPPPSGPSPGPPLAGPSRALAGPARPAALDRPASPQAGPALVPAAGLPAAGLLPAGLPPAGPGSGPLSPARVPFYVAPVEWGRSAWSPSRWVTAAGG